ncbi:NADH-quinone oxidoreductase subunit L [uncultured Desulfobacter sp.]|uniref:NADH-quinone oxidoreductase subunit L n=1 Tax=uncultured Desulfobacter sp. TaxID=240139 RepID=UPI002AAA6D5D|nr:NADH-quinone oxidoreductase subunit L [uncultured Desulfobacter sp.]
MPESIQGLFLWAIWAAPAAPLISFAMIMIFFRQYKTASAAISICAVTVSLLCAVLIMVRYHSIGLPIRQEFSWITAGDLNIPFGLMVDPLNMLMLLIVTMICFLVQIYSLGYMSEDPGFSRYYGYMSLFAWAMICLVLATTLLQLYIFWELVGVSSYLLIGFWFEKFSASKAGKKAFIMTRAGDFAFFCGLLLLLTAGNVSQITQINHQAAQNMPPALVTLSGLLILGGIIGKSAQFPLMTWLPDAMEGPTPVSALLHSATMVAAGVYLLARLFPFFSLSDVVMTTVLSVGTISMLMAATMAMVATDIKQVWAFSTISQLGYMLMGLGSGGYFAGVFHLATHAAFKALLFLCAGVLIHAYHTNDIFEIAQKGAGRMKITITCMIIAACALIGLWPFSGFFSKEAILSSLSGLDSPLWLAAGVAGVFMTAYYTTRLVFILLLPRNDGPEKTAATAVPPEQRFEPPAMAAPLVVLACITLGAGFLHGILWTWLVPQGSHGTAHGFSWPIFLWSQGAAAAAILIAWYEFGRKKAFQVGFVERFPWLYILFKNRWYLDHFYQWAFSRIVDKGLSKWCKENDDRVIDGIVHALGKTVLFGGNRISGWHNTMIQTKLRAVFAILFALIFFNWIAG